LEKLSLFANDGERDRHYLVAESFIFSNEEVDILQAQQRDGTLKEYLYCLSKHHADSVLKNLAKQDIIKLEALIHRNPLFEETNVAYQIYSSGNENRVLVIYNARRLADFVEKRQLNPNASGEQGLLHKPEALSFHVDPSCKEPWITRLQDSC
jgi:hypothetical protein